MSQRVKRPNRTDDGCIPTKRRKRPTMEEEEAASLAAAASWQPRPFNDLKSIYNRTATEAPAELFRKDLISAMKLPDSEPLASDEYWVIIDQWKQEWERGVQVPVNPDSLPEPSVVINQRSTIKPHQEFKIPKTKYIRITKDEHFHIDKHVLSTAPAKSEAACSYDLDETDVSWLKLLNGERAACGLNSISEEKLERVIERLEINCWDKIQSILRNEEGLGIEYDENVICDVCRSPDSEEGNEMVFCDSCNICVHQACYGITRIPEGQWLCGTCALSQRPECVLCPNKGGAMKATRSGQKWAHVSCALWIPEVSIGCVEKMEPITKVSSIPQSRWALICVLCRERVGACIQCSVKTCKTAYHVTCAFKHGLEMRAIIEDENADDGVKLRSYCEKHSKISKKEKSTCSGSEDDDNKRKKRKDMTSEEKNQARAARLHEIEAEFDKHVSIKDINMRLDVDSHALQYIYNYWKVKRRAGNNKPLLPPKSEDVDVLSHKQEQADLEKMKTFVQLRQDLERVRNLCYMVSRREKLSRTFFRMREQTFHKQAAVLESSHMLSSSITHAVIEANHGPGIYDRLYSHNDAEEHKDFEIILARIAGLKTKEDKKPEINGLLKSVSVKKENPYKRTYFNGSSKRRSTSLYGSSTSDGVGSSSSSDEHFNNDFKDFKTHHRAVVVHSSNNSSSADEEKPAQTPLKRKCGRPRLNKKRRKHLTSRTVVKAESSSEDDIKVVRKSRLQQVRNDLGMSGTESDEFHHTRSESQRSKVISSIYSESSNDSSNASNSQHSSRLRTKAAVKEFLNKPSTSKSPNKTTSPSSKKKSKPIYIPSDLIVPQREAAKKASENMKSSTSTRVIKEPIEQQPPLVETKSPSPEVKTKPPKQKTKDIKATPPKKEKNVVDIFDIENEKEDEILSYVPQRQAAKKATENIKSGLGKPVPATTDHNNSDKDKHPEISVKPAKIQEHKRKSSTNTTNSSTSSAASSSSDSSDNSSTESDKPPSESLLTQTKRSTTTSKDWPFLDKGAKSEACSSNNDRSKKHPPSTRTESLGNASRRRPSRSNNRDSDVGSRDIANSQSLEERSKNWKGKSDEMAEPFKKEISKSDNVFTSFRKEDKKLTLNNIDHLEQEILERKAIRNNNTASKNKMNLDRLFDNAKLKDAAKIFSTVEHKKHSNNPDKDTKLFQRYNTHETADTKRSVVKKAKSYSKSDTGDSESSEESYSKTPTIETHQNKLHDRPQNSRTFGSFPDSPDEIVKFPSGSGMSSKLSSKYSFEKISKGETDFSGRYKSPSKLLKPATLKDTKGNASVRKSDWNDVKLQSSSKYNTFQDETSRSTKNTSEHFSSSEKSKNHFTPNRKLNYLEHTIPNKKLDKKHSKREELLEKGVETFKPEKQQTFEKRHEVEQTDKHYERIEKSPDLFEKHAVSRSEKQDVPEKQHKVSKTDKQSSFKELVKPVRFDKSDVSKTPVQLSEQTHQKLITERHEKLSDLTERHDKSVDMPERQDRVSGLLQRREKSPNILDKRLPQITEIQESLYELPEVHKSHNTSTENYLDLPDKSTDTHKRHFKQMESVQPFEKHKRHELHEVPLRIPNRQRAQDFSELFDSDLPDNHLKSPQKHTRLPENIQTELYDCELQQVRSPETHPEVYDNYHTAEKHSRLHDNVVEKPSQLSEKQLGMFDKLTSFTEKYMNLPEKPLNLQEQLPQTNIFDQYLKHTETHSEKHTKIQEKFSELTEKYMHLPQTYEKQTGIPHKPIILPEKHQPHEKALNLQEKQQKGPDSQSNFTENSSNLPVDRATLSEVGQNLSEDVSALHDLLENWPKLPENLSNTLESRPDLSKNQLNMSENLPSLVEDQPNLLDNRPNLLDTQSNLHDNRPNLLQGRSNLLEDQSNILHTQSSVTENCINLPEKLSSIQDKHPRLYEKIPNVPEKHQHLQMSDKQQEIFDNLTNLSEKHLNMLDQRYPELLEKQQRLSEIYPDVLEKHPEASKIHHKQMFEPAKSIKPLELNDVESFEKRFPDYMFAAFNQHQNLQFPENPMGGFSESSDFANNYAKMRMFVPEMFEKRDSTTIGFRELFQPPDDFTKSHKVETHIETKNDGIKLPEQKEAMEVAKPSTQPPQIHKDGELLDFDMLEDGFGISKAQLSFPLGNVTLFKEDSKEDSARETLNLVEKLRMELSKKSYSNHDVDDNTTTRNEPDEPGIRHPPEAQNEDVPKENVAVLQGTLDPSTTLQADERWVPPSNEAPFKQFPLSEMGDTPVIQHQVTPYLEQSSPSPYADIHPQAKWADSQVMPTRRSSSSSAASTSSSCSQANEERPDVMVMNHPNLEMQFGSGMLHQFQSESYTTSQFSDSQFINPVSLFPPPTTPNFSTQIPFSSPGAAMFPPVYHTPTPLSKPVESTICTAAFTSSEHNMALTAAMVSLPTPTPTPTETEAPQSPKPTPPTGKKSPSKPTRTSARFQNKSPEKSPRTVEVPKTSVSGRGRGGENKRSTGRGVARGRGRGRGRGKATTTAQVQHQDYDGSTNTINKLVGTVYDFDFDDENDSMADLKSMRERRKSADVHAPSPKLSDTASPKVTLPVKHVTPPPPPIVEPVLPGPVDMRTYSNFDESQSFTDNNLLSALSGTNDRVVHEDIDEDFEKAFGKVEPEIANNIKASLSDSRNQLKVKIKGPIANYTAAVPPPSSTSTNTNIISNIPVGINSGTSNLRRMRKKELLRQYWTQENMDDNATVPEIASAPAVPSVNRTIITIPKAVASMTSIPTRDDYRDYRTGADDIIEPKVRKESKARPGALSRELKQLDLPPTEGVEGTPAERRRSIVRGKAIGKTAPKLKIKIGGTHSIITDSTMDRIRPPKKRLSTQPIQPSVEDLKRDSMKFRKMVMADFGDRKKKKDKSSKHRKRKNQQLQIVTNDDANSTKLIIRFNRKADSECENKKGSSNNEDEVDHDKKESGSSSVEVLKDSENNVRPIKLKLARCQAGSGYVMKTEEAPRLQEPPVPLPLNKDCEVR